MMALLLLVVLRGWGGVVASPPSVTLVESSVTALRVRQLGSVIHLVWYDVPGDGSPNENVRLDWQHCSGKRTIRSNRFKIQTNRFDIAL